MKVSLRSTARMLTVVASAALLASCKIGVLNPEGPVGAANKTILIDSVAIMLAIVVPTILAIFAFAFWFRAGNSKARHLPTFAYSGQLELVVWAIPALVVMLLGGVAWIGAHELDPAKPIASTQPALEIQVVSLDWKWLFIYPDQKIAAVNTLTIPAGTPVHFALTSASVMNAFFIPQLGSMIYTMNGMSTQLNLQADRPGTYHGLSSHFSGDGFADMTFEVRAVPAADFEKWAQGAAKSDRTLDAAAYAELTKQTTNAMPATFRLGDADLYQSIVTQKIAAGPGPQSDQGVQKPSPQQGADHVR